SAQNPQLGILPEALTAIGELLVAAEQHGMGVVFQPDGEGWRIGYVLPERWPAYEDLEWTGGRLANAYDLHIAAAASLKPLIEMGERTEAFFSSRDHDR